MADALWAGASPEEGGADVTEIAAELLLHLVVVVAAAAAAVGCARFGVPQTRTWACGDPPSRRR